ncbi:MAG: hypothetical protein ABW122_08775, partial [Ilumatobacteraceae bacterium]
MPDLDGPSGVAVWESDTWRVTALAWMDDRLAAAGIARLGDVEQPRVRPWASPPRPPPPRGGGGGACPRGGRRSATAPR